MRRVSVEQVMSWGPCERYTEVRVRKLFGGRKTVSAMNILDMHIQDEDKLWAVLRPELIDEPVLHELACRFAETVLPVWDGWAKENAQEQLYAPARAINAKRLWLAGEVTDQELDDARGAVPGPTRSAAWSAAQGSACDAAWSAAQGSALDAASDAARYAAQSHAWSAVCGPACNAAWDVAWFAALEEQVKIVREAIWG